MQSSFFDAQNYDRKYNSGDFVKYFAALVGNGVFANPANGMQVYAKSGMQLGVRAGKCWINGRIGYADGTDTVTLKYGDEGSYRYDAVVARLDLTVAVRDIHIDVITGNGASTLAKAVKPVPIRDATRYDIVLAYIAIGESASSVTSANITDTRADSSLCGVVSGLVDHIDTSGLFSQYEAQWELLKAGCAQDASAVIKAWSALNALKTINNTPPTNGNINLTQSLIPSDGTAYQMPYYIQSGTVTITSDMRNGTGITFPRQYKSTPLLALTAPSAPTTTSGNPAPVIVGYSGLTATGFTLIPYAFNSTGEKYYSGAMQGVARWIALGKI